MLKALAVLRTIVLVFLSVFTARSMPVFISPARTFDETYARCATSVDQLQRAAFLAIGWIALETVIGWIMATRKKKDVAPAAAPAPK
jgi:heme A synthase